MTRTMYATLAAAGILLSTLALPAAIASADDSGGGADSATSSAGIAGADAQSGSAPQSGNYWELIRP